MQKSEEVRRLEKDLVASEELRQALDAAVKEAVESGTCRSDYKCDYISK